MKTLKATIIEILKDKGCIYSSVSPFMDHLQIRIPDDLNFENAFISIQKAITGCIEKHLPQRQENVLIEVQNSEQEKTFRISETEQPPKPASPSAIEVHKTREE